MLTQANGDLVKQAEPRSAGTAAASSADRNGSYYWAFDPGVQEWYRQVVLPCPDAGNRHLSGCQSG